MTLRSILLVEDDDDLRTILQQKLTDAGYRVATAINGHKAIQLFARESFELVLTDILMPDKDGLETIMELRKSKPGIPIIAMSGGGRIPAYKYLEIARKLGAVATIEKPFSDEELFISIALALP